MTAHWSPVVSKAAGPVYLAIADAIAADIASGRLAEGTRLPPQRALADQLGIDFTTVSRAYSEAQRRGLVEGRVGQGTYVRSRASAPAAPIRAAPSAGSGGMVDMSMNLPPRFDDAALSADMWATLAELETQGGLDLLMRYQEPGGSVRDRAAGVAWLSPRLPGVAVERTLVCPGAQGALLATLGAIAAPGDVVLAESLSYPGFLSLAAHLRLRPIAVPGDAQGPLPAAFEALCAAHRPRAFYTSPTIQNPTTLTIPEARRRVLADIARAHGVAIVEDDAYGALPRAPVPPFAALAPDVTYHVAGLAKCLAPALRIAYLVAPDTRGTARLVGALRATASMASPLTAALATRWIEEGTAARVLEAIRREAAARQALAAGILPRDAVSADPEGFHLWLRLSPPWTRGEFTARLRTVGVGVVASDAFALDTPPEAVRLGLGASASRDDLAQSLRIVADLLGQPPAMSSLVV
ncbi:PLP-dependent aminotransferase family protein [Nitrospirillum sp. BR 11164]|uniref:aminotransferase-like domain-containing protein n=1 Tax=Nitrospirillum sp. BR 11164 TaxID=3104324 RepID=UPI002B0014FA|nr:PLP-dependent aminotransferase family protein [Nitrospirillum sp. BR 11164]MEA1648684.1 PLP-dependent aminotransferase family protein [Nitrospirillum sp. BR 11164]